MGQFFILLLIVKTSNEERCTAMIKKGTIFLIEDNPDDEDFAIRAMKKNNISNDIVVAHDGAEALDYIFDYQESKEKNRLNNLQVILLDLNLPKISGIEVLKKIKSDERTKLFPIVVLTSSSEEKDIIECYKLGANSYIQKAIDFVEFSESIKQIILYWLGLNKTTNTSEMD